MSKVKKLLAIILSMAMIMGMSLTTFAADSVIGNSDDVGNIIVSGIEEKDRTDVMAYPIAMAQYDQTTGVFTGYANPYELADITAPTLEELQDIKDSSPSGGFQLTYDAATNTYRATDKPVGMYLVSVPTTEATTYSLAVASIKYSSNGTDNIIDPAELTMASKVVGPATWVKKNIEVEVDKKVENTEGTTADIGDTLNYTVSIDPIPNYSGSYPVLKVTDVLSAGLDYNNDLVVTIDQTQLTADEDYTVSFNSETRTLIVNFVVNGTYTLNEYAGKEAVIKYTAELNENALLNGGENGNEVTLEYTRDSTVDGDNTTMEDKTHTYTFDIDGQTVGSLTEGILNKYGEEIDESTQKNKPLKDAEFTLYTDAACENKYSNDVFSGTTTTDDKGQMKITGLAAGTYYLKETKAPSGYTVNTHVYKIVISATIDETSGLLESWTITIDDNATTRFVMDNGTAKLEGNKGTVDIQNTTLSTLPSTGGIGTTIFTIGGCVIMIAAAGLYFASRRRQENK